MKNLLNTLPSSVLYRPDPCLGWNGKLLTPYRTEFDARRAAKLIETNHGIETRHYRCVKCGQWHTRSVECPYCLDSEGGSKYRYLTRDAALRNKDKREREVFGLKLAIIDCKYYGFHLTKNIDGRDVYIWW